MNKNLWRYGLIFTSLISAAVIFAACNVQNVSLPYFASGTLGPAVSFFPAVCSTDPGTMPTSPQPTADCFGAGLYMTAGQTVNVAYSCTEDVWIGFHDAANITTPNITCSFQSGTWSYTAPDTGFQHFGVQQNTGAPSNVTVCVTLPGQTCAPPAALTSGGAINDGRINERHGDLYIALYPSTDDKGKPAIDAYCINQYGGNLGFKILLSAFTDIPSPPQQNTEVFEANTCVVMLRAFVLTTGEYQINIGNDGGKIDVIIFTGMPPDYVYFLFLDPGV